MLRGLWNLTWIEIKIFMREPLGAIGTIVIPVVVFVILGRVAAAPGSRASANLVGVALPVLAEILMLI